MASTSPATLGAISLLKDGLAISYLNTATFAVVAWDLLLCFTEDIDIAVVSGLSASMLAYFSSRFGALLLTVLALVVQNAPIANCELAMHLVQTTGIIATSATAWLFLSRVRAVYENSKPVTLFFGIFWLAIPATSALVTISARSSVSPSFSPISSMSSLTAPISPLSSFTNIKHGGSDRCAFSSIRSLASVGLWVKAAYDTSVFIAITSRIISHSRPQANHVRKPSRWQFFRGAGLPRIYRDLLKAGQLYYFVTIGVTLMGACAAALPISTPYRVGLSEPSIAIESIMACRVFRRIVLDSRKSEEGPHENIVLTTMLPSEASWACETSLRP